MNLGMILTVLRTERECVRRAGYEECDRDCAKCDLLMDTKDILEAYDAVLRALEEVNYEGP